MTTKRRTSRAKMTPSQRAMLLAAKTLGKRRLERPARITRRSQLTLGRVIAE